MTPIHNMNALHTAINRIDSKLTDAHLAMEDRTDHCFDNELTPIYKEIAELKLILKKNTDTGVNP